MALVTYDDVVRHLKQDGVLDVSPADADVQLKIEQASAIVQLHLKRPAEWDINSIAADDPEFAWVQAIILKVVMHLYRFRGDGENEPSLEDLFRKCGSSMLRDPAMA